MLSDHKSHLLSEDKIPLATFHMSPLSLVEMVQFVYFPELTFVS